MSLFQLLEEIAYIDSRDAAVPGDDRGYAHAQVVLSFWQARNVFSMRMDIDETGRDNLAFGVHHFCREFRVNAAELRNATVFDRNVTNKPWTACAIDNATVGDYQIES